MAWYQGHQGPPTPAERIPSPSPRPPSNVHADIAMPGFGIEFEHCLRRAWEDHKDKERGRLAKYARFGMTKDEARRATPEYMREAYQTLVADQLADVYTPSPSPSIPPTPKSIELEDPNITKIHPSQHLIPQDIEENNSRDTTYRISSLYQRIKEQPTPDSAGSSPAMPAARVSGARDKVGTGWKITKKPRTYGRVQVRNPPRSRHHMETRSRKLARKSCLG